jgi:glycosyltransferase involved in cell wall biosynthesis
MQWTQTAPALGSSPDTRTNSAGARHTILFFDHTAMMSGGEIALLHLVRHLDRERFEPVVVLSSSGPLVEELQAADVETHVLPLAPSVVEARKDHLNRSALTRGRDMARLVVYSLRLAAFMRRRKIHLLHTNSLKADIIGGFAGRLARVPVLWHVRDRIADDYLPPKVARLFRWLSHRLPQGVIANSRATLSTLRLPGRRLAHGCAVHDGIPIEDLPVEEKRGVAPECSSRETRVGIIGRISPWKGQHIFLEAAAAVLKEFPGTRFQIIGSALFGEEDYERTLRAQEQALGLSGSVEWLGFRTDVPALIRDLDILVHASTVGEPFGQVVVEGMAAGKPVVATHGGGIPEIVEDGVSGVLVPMNDAPAMAAAISGLLREPARARALGIAGRERVRSHFTIERTARQVEQVYDAMLCGKRSRKKPCR